MGNDKKIAIFIAGMILVGLSVTILFPKERHRNADAVVRIGAGDDVSGILMDETVEDLSKKYTVSESLESSSFQDC